MEVNFKTMKSLFLQQSYEDCFTEYRKNVQGTNSYQWDYIILTASNEDQARNYRRQLQSRVNSGMLPKNCKYKVLPDPDGKRVGSGGATFHVLAYLAKEAEKEGKKGADIFRGKRILVIHSGGDSKRVPQYSCCGKLFSPVPRQLPNHKTSTLFDEFIITTSAVASRFSEGMLVLSGDVLLLYHPLQIDVQNYGATAISIKEDVETGKNHGVFLSSAEGFVDRFLHKQSVENLRRLGAVNENNCVNLDTGAVLLNTSLMNSIYSLISTDGVLDLTKFDEFVNEKARISFYGDFLYPLAQKATLEEYYKEAPEGSMCEELLSCRKKIWDAISEYQMKVVCLSPAEFIHFGTTHELKKLMCEDVDDYIYLNWKRLVCTNLDEKKKPINFACNTVYINGENVQIESGCYVENCELSKDTYICSGSVVSGMHLKNVVVPGDVVLHGVKLNSQKFVCRIYGTKDNPKDFYAPKQGKDITFCQESMEEIIKCMGITMEELWQGQEPYLWFANLYPVCDTMEEALEASMLFYKIAKKTATIFEKEKWLSYPRMSLYTSFNEADEEAMFQWKSHIEDAVFEDEFLTSLRRKLPYEEALSVYGEVGISQKQVMQLCQRAKTSNFSDAIRIYYALSKYLLKNPTVMEKQNYKEYSAEALESACFGSILKEIYEHGLSSIPDISNRKIVKDRVDVALPVRVNWGGGWTDTPPFCNEEGGVVLNAAITLQGQYPIHVTVKKVPEYHIEFESTDIGVTGVAETVEEIRDCHNPFDNFALHKAALIASGIVPLTEDVVLSDILKKLGGGIYISTQVIGIPKGSGLGTSSILAGACIKAIFEFLGGEVSNDELYDIVLCMEQIMSTGGGWQDQVGGIAPGIKMITSKPGIKQKLQVEQLSISQKMKDTLEERFCLIYTGQRRLARNLLREVVGNYIGSRRESVEALQEMKNTAWQMKDALLQEDIHELARLFNKHWELSKQLDYGSTNTCIEQIFLSVEDLIEGRFIAGAGGGGFLQVILKENVTRKMVSERLHQVFQDSGVDVWECSFLW